MPDLLYADGLVLYSGSEENFRLVGRFVKEGSIYEISVNSSKPYIQIFYSPGKSIRFDTKRKTVEVLGREVRNRR